jgi:hypothetical protein
MPIPEEFLTTVIRPTLIEIGLHSTAAEQLLLGTAMQESDLVHRRQMGNGPARSFFQMEPATHNDIWQNFLKFKKELADKITNLLTSPIADKIEELENNDRYACAMARVHYLRVPEALPAADDIEAIANYWKNHYNTLLGAGTAAQFIAKWRKAFPQ